jgi:hypothetical protein
MSGSLSYLHLIANKESFSCIIIIAQMNFDATFIPKNFINVPQMAKSSLTTGR